MKVKKAVIAAAGLGTRILPASKAIPKEMLNVVDKPAIHYIVEEIVKSGIEEIVMVLSRGKTVIEDYFDRSLELENALIYKGMKRQYDEIFNISNMANIVFVRQKVPNGLGGAVLCTEAIIKDDPFCVVYADDVISAKEPVCKQLCEVYEKYNLGVVAIRNVRKDEICKYSSVKVDSLEDSIFRVDDMVEKPKEEEILSTYSIFGRCVLPSSIFSILKSIDYGKGKELQLTDAMKVLANKCGMIGVAFKGQHYDMGSRFGVLKANIDYALENEEIKEEFLNYIKDLAGSVK